MHHLCRNNHLILTESTHTVVSHEVALARIQESRRTQVRLKAQRQARIARRQRTLTILLVLTSVLYTASAVGAI